MDIAKHIPAEKYLDLNLTDYDHCDWAEAINILRLRLVGRFIEPADRLIEFEKDLPPTEKKYGFAVLAIDCLLCETIQAFYEGVTDSTGYSKRLFKTFLLERDSFKGYFGNEKEAEDFYINFRCGILHQAQTAKNARVWAVGNMVARTEGVVTVNRELFHSNVKDELDKYVAKLMAKSDPTLLKNFRDKMDFIAGK